MKYCPRCNETYKDENLNFCLNDGELLNQMNSEDAPPTVMLDPTRITNEGNWGNQNTNFNDFGQQNQQIYQQPFSSPMTQTSSGTDSTLPVIALIIGISSLVFSCCYGGLILGPIAGVIGFIGMNNAKNYPEQYSGKEMATIGMILGGISFFLTFIFIFLAIISG